MVYMGSTNNVSHLGGQNNISETEAYSKLDKAISQQITEVDNALRAHTNTILPRDLWRYLLETLQTRLRSTTAIEELDHIQIELDNLLEEIETTLLA